jgi:hypothetical protein
LSKTKTQVQLVRLSAADTGSNGRESLASFYARVRRLGYELCSPEVVVQLRLRYRDQPIGESLDIAMEPIATYEGAFVRLSLANGGTGLMLAGQTVPPDTVPGRTTRFVFVRPSQMALPDLSAR